ncbi:MAG: DUF6765 family protein [Pseudomonadota bacterium]
MTPAKAYEADIHYSTTYVLASAAGWVEADALTIASANQGVDENQDTARNNPGTLEKLAPEVAGTCKNASLASSTVVRIPAPRFPRLNPDVSPHLVRADGTYQRVRDGDFGTSRAGTDPERNAALIPNYDAHEVQVSHWSQLLALTLVPRVALLSADGAFLPN